MKRADKQGNKGELKKKTKGIRSNINKKRTKIKTEKKKQ